MNKKVLMLTIMLLAVAMLATPALAETPKKIPVTLVMVVNPASVSVGEAWTTEGDVYHTRGGYMELSTYQVLDENGDVILDGWSYSTFMGNMNLKTGEGNTHYDSTLVYPEGTFEGVVNTKGPLSINPKGVIFGISGAVVKGVWHGTGAYQGWTLVRQDVVGQPHVGYLLTP